MHRRAARLACAASTKRSWLKFVTIALKPPPSTPIIWLAGTRTSSKVTTLVPALQLPCSFMRSTLTPGDERLTSSRLSPFMPGPPVRTATVNHEAPAALVIHFFWPFTTQ